MIGDRTVAFCDCHSPDHQLIFEVEDTSWRDDSEVVRKDLLIYYRLAQYASLWKRLKNAYKYVTKRDVARIDYLDIIISDVDELNKLRDKIDEVIEFKNVK